MLCEDLLGPRFLFQSSFYFYVYLTYFYILCCIIWNILSRFVTTLPLISVIFVSNLFEGLGIRFKNNVLDIFFFCFFWFRLSFVFCSFHVFSYFNFLFSCLLLSRSRNPFILTFSDWFINPQSLPCFSVTVICSL